MIDWLACRFRASCLPGQWEASPKVIIRLAERLGYDEGGFVRVGGFGSERVDSWGRGRRGGGRERGDREERIREFPAGDGARRGTGSRVLTRAARELRGR